MLSVPVVELFDFPKQNQDQGKARETATEILLGSCKSQPCSETRGSNFQEQHRRSPLWALDRVKSLIVCYLLFPKALLREKIFIKHHSKDRLFTSSSRYYRFYSWIKLFSEQYTVELFLPQLLSELYLIECSFNDIPLAFIRKQYFLKAKSYP